MAKLTEKDKDRLAILNGLTEHRYKDKVKKKVNKKYDKNKENSIDRKTLKDIIDIISKLPKELLGEDITKRKNIVEFLKYNDDVEALQAETKAEIGKI